MDPTDPTRRRNWSLRHYLRPELKNTFPRSFVSPRDGSSWAATPDRTTKSRCIASGLTNFCLALAKLPTLSMGAFCATARRLCMPPPFWSDPAFNHPEQPVVGVSWYEAIRYCEWLSASGGGITTGGVTTGRVTTGRNFRLPTEAEWEHAARGGREGALFPWGDADPQSLPGYANRCAGHWKSGPEPVGRAEPNAYGLYNMCDNVHEWCSDWYAPAYYAVSPESNPRGPEIGERRASRGGSWRHHIKMSRCAARSSIPPEFKYADYGFRVACDVQLQGRG